MAAPGARRHDLPPAAPLVLGWIAVAAAEVALGRLLYEPPSAAGAGVELLGALALGGLHAAAARARPGSLLWLPELPAVAVVLAWGLAASASGSAPFPGGGAPASGGLASAGLALWGTAAAGLVASKIPIQPAWTRWAALRSPLPAVLAALAAVFAAGHADPSWHPSDATLDPLGAGLVLALGLSLVLSLVAAWRARVAILLACAAALLATRPPRTDPGPPGPLVLLVTVDTLRTDVAAEMASVRWMSSRGVTFEDALAASSWTVPSVGSMVTGRWPSGHGAGRPGRGWPGIAGLDAQIPTVAERFRAAGWRTGASVANAFLVPLLGFQRGFETFAHADAVPGAPLLAPWLAGRTAALDLRSRHRDDAEAVVDRALAWWEEGRSEPTLLWVHLLDPHTPYHHAVLTPDNPLYPVVGPIPGEDLDSTAIRRGNLRDGPRERAAVAALYRAEVAAADAALSRLLTEIEARGALADATVVLTSDHGEELWDHGGFEHGHALWPEITRVPLLALYPGARPGARRSDPASGVDVAATLLAAAGIEASELDGVDLRGPIGADRLRRIQGTLYFRQQQAVVLGSYAALEVDGQPPALYDRVADPSWTQDRGPEAPEALSRLVPLLEPGFAERGEAAPLPLDTEALRALGYLE